MFKNHFFTVFLIFFYYYYRLEIEKGRYNKTSCEERLCKNCGVIEDEAHFILKCKVNQNLRETMFNNIELDNEIFFLNFSDEQKLVYLLNPTSVRHVRVIGFYLKRSLEPGNYKTYKTCFIIPC
jgi:hypothetical protein